jgi:hypothetical protein
VKAAAATGGAIVINIFAKPQAMPHPPPQPQALGPLPGPPQQQLAQPALRKPPPATPPTKAPPVPTTSLEHDLFFYNR